MIWLHQHESWRRCHVIIWGGYVDGDHIGNGFACACRMILWELTTAQIPFEEERWNYQVEEKILSGQRPIFPSMAMEEVKSPWKYAYCTLVSRCWHPQPSQRPSVHEIHHRLQEIYVQLLATEKGRVGNYTDHFMDGEEGFHRKSISSSACLGP